MPVTKKGKIDWGELAKEPFQLNERVETPLGPGAITGMAQTLSGWVVWVKLDKETETEAGDLVKVWKGPAVGVNSEIPESQRKRKRKENEG